LTYVSQLATLKIKGEPKQDLSGWIPRDFVTLEESEGLFALEQWRAAVSLAE